MEKASRKELIALAATMDLWHITIEELLEFLEYNPNIDDENLTFGEAGAILGVSRRTMYRLIEDGSLTRRQVGDHAVRFSKKEVQAFACGGM